MRLFRDKILLTHVVLHADPYTRCNTYTQHIYITIQLGLVLTATTLHVEQWACLLIDHLIDLRNSRVSGLRDAILCTVELVFD